MKLLKTVLISAIVASSLAADTGADLEISPYVGAHFFNGPRDTKTSPEAGVIVEKAIGDNGLALAGALGYAQGKAKSDDKTRRMGTYGLNLIKNYDIGSKLIPYVGVGAAGTFNNNTAIGPNALMGLKYKLTDALNLRAEVSDNYLFSKKNDVKAILGLGFLFGGSKAQTIAASEPVKKVEEPKEQPKAAQAQATTTSTAAAVEVDSDGDGVVDSKDKCPNTLAGLKVDDQGCFISADLKINFDTSKSVVKKEYMAKLEAFAKFLNDNKSVNVTIEGHTDNAGKAKANQTLSERRAKAVMDILVKEYKVDAKQLKSVGYGATKPIASNKTAAGKAENRRIMAVADKVSQTPTK